MRRSSCAEGIGSVRSLVVIMVGVVAPSLSDFTVRAGVTPCLSVPRAPPLTTRLGWVEKTLKIAMKFGNLARLIGIYITGTTAVEQTATDSSTSTAVVVVCSTAVLVVYTAVVAAVVVVASGVWAGRL